VSQKHKTCSSCTTFSSLWDLKVQLPMVLEMDNKGAVNLANSWSVGGRTRHVDVQMFFLRELKDDGLIVIRHISGLW
jgi:hypothetical protein